MDNLRFLCRILASATHEMQNILAIIKESGALTGDVLDLNGPPRLKHGDKLFAALGTLEAQVERGRTLTAAINTCAHAAAAEYPELELPAFCAVAGLLSERMVRLKECTFTRAMRLEKGRIRADGFDVIQAIYHAVERVLADCAAGDALTLALLPHKDDEALVRVECATARATPQCDADLTALAGRIGARLHAEPGALDLIFPLLR